MLVKFPEISCLY